MVDRVGAMDLAQLAATPAPPAAGRVRLYAKGDGVAYLQTPAGVESPVGSGAGGGGGATMETWVASLTANMNITSNTYVDATGCSVTVPVAATTDRFLVIGTMYVSGSGASNVLAQAQLVVNGTVQPGAILGDVAVNGTQQTVHQQWVVTGVAAGSRIFKFQVQNYAGAGTVIVGGTHTKFTVVRLSAPASNVPVGGIIAHAGATAPAGYLICDGSAVSRGLYPELFAQLGTQYGVGDGSTTFNLPNLKGRVPVGIDSAQTEFDTRGETGGAKTHTLVLAETPNHAHTQNTANSAAGAGPYAWPNAGLAAFSSAGSSGIPTTAVGSGGAHNNLQPYIAMNWIIRATAGGGLGIQSLAPGSGGFTYAANVATSGEGSILYRTDDGQATLSFYVTASASVFNLFQLPSGWFPAKVIRDVVWDATGAHRVTITTAGVVYLESPAITSGQVCYGTVTWPIAS